MPETTTERGVTLPCPKCGEADARILLDLSDLETVTCGSCEGEYTLSDVRDLIARWQPVLAWVASFPAPAQETTL